MIIGVTGHARNGKDSVANLLVANYGFTKLGFADGVRQLALAIDPFVNVETDAHFTEGNTPFARYSDVLKARGYEAAKGYADVRRLLQRIGTEAVRELFGSNAWVGLTAERIFKMREDANDPSSPVWADVNVVVSDVRFPNEAGFVRANNGIVVRVVRPGYEGSDTHASESGVDSIEADITLTAVDLDELATEVRDMMDIRVPALLAAREANWQACNTAETGPRATRVYLAAPWAQKAEAGVAKLQLIAAGLDVVSGWTERENTPAEIAPERMREQAELDRDEVNVADALVILGLSKSEGKATEMGMALAQGKRVILVKPDCVGNIFYNLPSVERVDTLDEAILLLDPAAADYMKNTTRIPVRREGDNVVAVETGEVIATKLGTLDSEQGYTAVIHSVIETLDPENPRKLSVITDVASDPHAHELDRHVDDGGPASE